MNLNTDHGKASKLLIEKYFTGELDKTASMRVSEHVQNCTVCGLYHQKLNEEKIRFHNIHPFHSFDNAQIPNNVRYLWYKKVITFLLQPALRPVYAFILIIGIVTPFFVSYVPRNISTGIRTKGSGQLSFLYRRNGEVFNGTVRDTFQAHDEIQIIYNSVAEQHLSLFSIDNNGTISFYFPENASPWCSIKIEKGSNIHYPSAIVLDTSSGHELIIALFTKRRIKVNEVQHWISNFTENKTFDLVELEQDIFTNPLNNRVIMRTLLLNKR